MVMKLTESLGNGFLSPVLITSFHHQSSFHHQ